MTRKPLLLLAWWIDKGASSTLTIGEAEPDEGIRKHLSLFFATEPKTP